MLSLHPTTIGREDSAGAVRSLWSCTRRVKRTIEFTLLSSLVATAAIAWFAGVDVIGFISALVASAAEAILAGLRFPVQLPLWAVALLTLPSFWMLTTLHRRFRPGTRRADEAGPVGAPRLAAPEARDVPQNEAGERSPEPPTETDYSEDVKFGVVWRWPGGLSLANLRAHCPACDSELVPHPGGGSLSRGLFCESCNKIRAAGEHPTEILPRVVAGLEAAVESGDSVNAPQRVEKARIRAEAARVAFPSAGHKAP
jgi:hypothetical protein